MSILRPKFAVLLLSFLLLAGAGVALLTRPSLAQNPPPVPTFQEQRDRMDAAYRDLPNHPYSLALKVPHLDPLRLSQALIDGTLNTPEHQKDFAFVIAHRGYHSEPMAAEHTGIDIMEAYLAGSDGIELDTKMSKDKFLVLGHDFTMRRETRDWTGAPPSTWGPLSFYPQYDPFYVDLATGNSWGDEEKRDRSNPQNPKRDHMYARDMWEANALDNFENLNGEKQTTLYEAMYFIAKYAPMQIWLDVKEWEDFQASVATIKQLRQDLAGDPNATNVLKNIFFKVTYGRINRTFPSGFPKSFHEDLGQPGLYYFLVFNPGDVPKFKDLGKGDSYAGYQLYCRKALDCVGAEFAYKYPGSPQGDFDTVLRSHSDYMASFHNSPPYIWYWQTQQDDLDQKATWGRWYARAEASCCGDRYDVMSLVGGVPEIDDLRPSANFMEDGYQAITTDNAMEVLRDLQRKGRRNLAASLATDSTNDYPTGGANLTRQIGADGLYVITVRAGGKTFYLHGHLPSKDAPSGLLSVREVNGRPIQTDTDSEIWFIKKRDTQSVTIQAALPKSGFIAAVDGCGGKCAQLVSLRADPGKSEQALLLAKPPFGGGTEILNLSNNNYQLGLLDQQGSPVVGWQVRSETNTWAFAPISPQFPEHSRNTIGPRGMTYCAEAPDGACGVSGKGTFTLGNATDFTMPAEGVASLRCNNKELGFGDEVSGRAQSCFYAPNPPLAWPKQRFTKCADQSNWCQSALGATVAYGNPATGHMTYRELADEKVDCRAINFGFDPSWGEAAQCFTTNQVIPGAGAFCADEGEICDFSGTAAVAYGAPGSKSFLYRTFTNGVRCTTKAFVADPAPGVKKACFYRDVSLPSLNRYHAAAKDFGTFNLYGVATSRPINTTYYILYGIDSRLLGKSVTIPPNGTVTFKCDPSSFNNVDPAPGVIKSCFVALSSDYAQFQPCRIPLTPCTLLGDHQNQANLLALTSASADGFAVGSTDYKLTTKFATPCYATNAGGFAREPLPGQLKNCLAAPLSLPQQAPPHFAFCGLEGETCYADGIRERAAYGADGKFTYDFAHLGTFTCGKEAFKDVDPAPGVKKACYVYMYD